MEHFIDENTVMRFYLKELEADHIEFLKGKESAKQKIAGMIGRLLDTEKMNDRIQIATGLWKVLFEESMSYLDKDKQGYDRLFSYFDEYVEFEELIFASDSFYRDHTLHCMWVYFLGEYVYRCGEFDSILEEGKQEMRLPGMIKEVITELGLGEESEFEMLMEFGEINQKMMRLEDSWRCVAALTHDLGYPLKKIEKINKSIRRVLPFYSINTFDDFKFEYGNANQQFIDTFLTLLSTTVNSTMNADEKSVAGIWLKIFEIDEVGNVRGVNREAVHKLSPEEINTIKENTKVEYRARKSYADSVAVINDFETYQHGIMSAFLLMKNLKAFQNMDIAYEEKIDTRSFDVAEFYVKQGILVSISDHTCETKKIRSIKSYSFLTFIDELEEFSRISRASQSREYVEEFCSTDLYMEDGWFTVDFTFDNDELDNLDPKRAFKGRCKRFLTLFSISMLDENLKIRLRCIGKLKKDSSVYQLEIARNHAKIIVDGVEQNIPEYLNSTQFYTSEEYAKM